MEMSETLPQRGKKDGAARRIVPRKPGPTVAAKPIVKIGVLVHDVARMRTTIFDQAVQNMGITCAQWWALANLYRHGAEGMNQTDLARLLGVTKSATGGVLDRLVERGLVERRGGDDDRRVKTIYITDRGHDLIRDMSPIAANLNALFLAGIDHADIEVAESVLRKLQDNLEMLFESGPNLRLPKAFKAKILAQREING